MRKTESLKTIKCMCNFKTLSSFKCSKANFDDSIFIASCLGDKQNEIFVYYESDEKAYHLCINFKSTTLKNFCYIFTQEFSQQVFEAIQTIFLKKECEKHGKEL